ncbi:complex I intermediate-associated protein 30, mitochondrial [Cotesia glomerata]|uniref:NADH:ubiquinone oxidoreductase intermediate-associated protein 30 domain-containing protein n=1 Tax=Cotesia glomerata TaxID=32391 RepID=A0AAV7J5L5_COTGL|nr:complex I intermediate-associated protein 30, mitochondrial [Cotesia glomerata]KAH0568051.1 hypothetical protein KQX54_018041 [Cotesia glomerata]
MTTHLIRSLNVIKKLNCKKFHTTCKVNNFYETNRKGGFPFLYDPKREEEPTTTVGEVKKACTDFIHELKLLKEETKENFRMDPPLCQRPGEVDIQWRFNGDPDEIYKWTVTSDKDYNLGYSTASLELTPNGTGLFSGVMDTRPIKDGKQKVGGYCNMRTRIMKKAFHVQDVLPWSGFTHLAMRIRGDGRTYTLNLHPKTTFDIMWNDLFNFVLYTRGGPYWQYVKIPFSKFLLSSKGRVQDIQGPAPVHNMSSFSITLSDQVPGPFRLEIDYIGIEQDAVFEEESAYELYKPPNPYYT